MRAALVPLVALAASSLIVVAPASAQTVRLAQNLSPISGVVIVAKEKGFFDKQGLKVEVSNFTTGKRCLDTVVGGGADFATTAEAPTTAAAMAGEPIAFLARMEYSDLKTLTDTSSGIKTLADLKAKRIGFTAGTGSEVYTMQLLRKAGIKAADVRLTNLPPQAMVAAMAAGSIDAFNTWEPHIFNGRAALGGKAAVLDTKGIYAETFNIVVMKDYLDKNRATVEKFLRAAIEAEVWMKANRAGAIAVIAKAVDMKPTDLADVWEEYVYNVVLDDKQMQALRTHAEWRLESGNHPPGAKMPDFSKFVFPEPLRAVAKDRVTLSGGS